MNAVTVVNYDVSPLSN